MSKALLTQCIIINLMRAIVFCCSKIFLTNRLFIQQILVLKPGPQIRPSQVEAGCDWDHDGEMFLQTENDSAQARSWGWTFLTPVQTVEDRGWPHYAWMPDGHISSLKVSWDCGGHV